MKGGRLKSEWPTVKTRFLTPNPKKQILVFWLKKIISSILKSEKSLKNSHLYSEITVNKWEFIHGKQNFKKITMAKRELKCPPHNVNMYIQDITTWNWNFTKKLKCSNKLCSWRQSYVSDLSGLK